MLLLRSRTLPNQDRQVSATGIWRSLPVFHAVIASSRTGQCTWAVHRDDQTDFDSPRAGEADFIITRHRNGPIAEIMVHFQGHYGRFAEPPT